MLLELLFYAKLNIVKTAKTLKKYARSHSIEIMKDKGRNINDPLGQLQASKAVFKVLFKDLFNEIKDFKYRIKMKEKKIKSRDRICSCLF